MGRPPNYPGQWETHVVLKDGSTAEIRPIRPSDRDALVEFHGQQSSESIYFRYFRYRPKLSDSELDHFTQVDYEHRMAFVAMVGPTLVAVARYEGVEGESAAEVAFFVHDDHQGKGLGTLMLEYLAAAARDRGLTGFTATVLPENYRMLGMFRSAGFEVSTRFDDGVIAVDLGIDLTPETSTVIADRHRRATARSVARILEAETVAVVGASRHPGSAGHELLRGLVEHRRHRGDPAAWLAAVNPAADEILGVPAYPTVAEASAALAESASRRRDGVRGDGAGDRASPDPEPGDGEAGDGGIDLAVVVVPTEAVVDVVRDCVTAGVRGLLIVSVGFSELDADGARREREIVELARSNGMRLIGPAAFGLISNVAEVELHALVHPVDFDPGRVAVASQSGPLGAALLQRLADEGLGISSFVGVGNRADVSVNDLLDYWGLDSGTDVVILYVENFGNLRNFSTVARRTSMVKPILATRPPSLDEAELLRQAGVILVDEVSQLVDQARVVVGQPQARGNRVVLISNSASLARLAASACRRQGLELVVPGGVADVVEDGSVLIGDLDKVSLRPSGDPDDYERIVVAAAVSEQVDLVLLALVPTAYLAQGALAQLLDRINRAIDKPIAAVGLVGPQRLRIEGLPVFAFPEGAARVLGRHARYGLWRNARTRAGETGEASPASDHDRLAPESLGADRADAANRLIDRILAGRREATLTLTSPDLPGLLEALGLSLAEWGAGDGLDEVVEVAERLGYPVVLKAANLPVRSVGESGGAAIDLHDRGALEAAHRRMSERLGVAMRAAVVQRMVPSVGALRVELLQDPAFGAMVAVGTGGSAYARVVPAARRFLPIDRSDAEALFADVVAQNPSLDLGPTIEAALVELVLTLAGVAEVGERVARITLNPTLLSSDGATPTDAEVVLRRRDLNPLVSVRHL